MMEDAVVLAHTDEAALDALRQTLSTRMSDKRYRHTCGVERMVQRLCALYCPDLTPLLRAAALLHDVTKEESLEKQLQMCEEFGIMVSDADKRSPKTFHARTAAACIERDFSSFACPTVVEAVRWHTTGHADMTLGEQLLYLADYIDDTRTFPDCVTLRDMFWQAKPEDMEAKAQLAHLREVLITSFDMTIRGLLEDGAPIGMDTMSARNDLLLRH